MPRRYIGFGNKSLNRIVRRHSYIGGQQVFIRCVEILNFSSSVLFHDALSLNPVDDFKSVQPLLQAFGRDLQKKVKVETWEELFHLNGAKLKAMEVTVKDRRYVRRSLMSSSLPIDNC